MRNPVLVALLALAGSASAAQGSAPSDALPMVLPTELPPELASGDTLHAHCTLPNGRSTVLLEYVDHRTHVLLRLAPRGRSHALEAWQRFGFANDGSSRPQDSLGWAERDEPDELRELLLRQSLRRAAGWRWLPDPGTSSCAQLLAAAGQVQPRQGLDAAFDPGDIVANASWDAVQEQLRRAGNVASCRDWLFEYVDAWWRWNTPNTMALAPHVNVEAYRAEQRQALVEARLQLRRCDAASLRQVHQVLQEQQAESDTARALQALFEVEPAA